MKITNAIILAVGLVLTGCALNQAEASATYIAAEGVAAAILKSHPEDLQTMQLLVADWSKFQLGTLTAADEAVLLKDIAAQTGSALNDPVKAALLDGAVQQLLANQNATAPTPLQGGAAAIVTDVMNGVGRELAIYTPPTAMNGLTHAALPYREYALR